MLLVFFFARPYTKLSLFVVVLINIHIIDS